MNVAEIVTQITLEAIKNRAILFKGTSDGKKEDVNAFNIEQISKFYNKMFNAVNDTLAGDYQEQS